MAKQSIALDDYTDPPRQDFDPRPNASQAVAAQKRARTMESAPDPPQPISYSYILAVVVTAILIAAGIAIISQSSQPRPLVATPAPTVEQATLAPSVTPPAPTSAPIATIAVYGSPTVVPQTGRGLGPIEPAAPAQPAAESTVLTYIEVVSVQAPHSPRGDGQPGPSGGNWVTVPTITSAQAEVIGAQKPHKVR